MYCETCQMEIDEQEAEQHNSYGCSIRNNEPLPSTYFEFPPEEYD